MVTVSANKKRQHAKRGLQGLTLMLAALLHFNASADGIFFPDALLNPPKRAKPVQNAPIPRAKPKTAPAPIVAPVEAPTTTTPTAVAPTLVSPMSPTVGPTTVIPTAIAPAAAPQTLKPAPVSAITVAPAAPKVAPTVTPIVPVLPPVQAPVIEAVPDEPIPPLPRAKPMTVVAPAPAIAPAPVDPKPVVAAPVSPNSVAPVQVQETLNVPTPGWRPGAPAPLPQVDEPDYVGPETAADDDGDGAAAGCDGSANCKGIRSNGVVEMAKKIKDAIIPKAQDSRAQRLAQASYFQAGRCRDFADFKERRMGIAKYKTVGKGRKKKRVQISVKYNSCNFFGKDNINRSKGFCAQAVREAFADTGIRIQAADARNLRPNLLRAGFKKVTYSPSTAKAGTVLVCNGGSSGYGHTEIVVGEGKQRRYCSDFCSPAPTCTAKKGYSNFTAYTL